MPNSLISKLVKFFLWALMGVSILITLLFFTNTVTENLFIVWAYILLAIAVVLAIAFPVVFFAQNPKNAVKALVGIAGIGIVLAIGYFMADTTPMVTATNHPNFSNPRVLAFTDAGIFATYILFGVAVLALLYSGVRGILKR